MPYNNILLISNIHIGSRGLLELAISIATPYKSQISIVIEIYEPELSLLYESDIFEEYKKLLFVEAHFFYQTLISDIDYPVSCIYTYSNLYLESILDMQLNFDLVICSYYSYNLSRESESLINKRGGDVLIVRL